ncbi:MAG TPA: hypothetical protein VHA12_01290 [Candidatus Nanoarchaeia archaeon]|nr:hypothetical protein [Candidatus Nanoarchaeia archaeon]
MILTVIISIFGGFLFGKWLNKQAYDELKIGKRWFRAIIWTMALVFLIALIFFRNIQGFESLIGTVLFLATVSYSSYKKAK